MFLIVFLQLLLFISLILLLVSLRKRLTWKRLERYESKISGNIDIAEKYNGEKVLMTNAFVHGVSIEHPSINKSYWYAVAEKIVNHCEKKKKSKVLFIGLGANTSSRLVQKRNSSIHQVIVEIDPLIVSANKKYFHLNDMQNTDIITDDIITLITSKKSVWRDAFDVIIVDTFDSQPPYLLKGSHDPDFLNHLYAWLKSDGMFLFNAPVKTRGVRIDELLSYLRTKFITVEHKIIHDPRGYHNYVIASSSKHKFKVN